MRKQFVILVILGLILFIAAWTQTDEKNVKETVSVLNIEVPVRVFYKGNPVDNLTKNDFSLIVNGRERDITGFNIVRKQIEVQELEKEKEYPPRYFVLAVNVTNFAPEIKDGVKEVIDRIMRKNDAMLLFINNKTLVIRNFISKTDAKEKIFNMINTESIVARKRMLLHFKQLEGEINLTKFRLSLKQSAGKRNPFDLKDDVYSISDFLRKYLVLWKDYKNR